MFAPIVTPGAAGLPVLHLLGGITLRDGGWERERTYDSWSTTSSFPAAVVSYELTYQLESKLLDSLERCVVLTVALSEDESISNGYIKQKVKNRFVEFPVFCSAAVVAPDLVTSVNSSHVVVVHNGHGTRN